MLLTVQLKMEETITSKTVHKCSVYNSKLQLFSKIYFKKYLHQALSGIKVLLLTGTIKCGKEIIDMLFSPEWLKIIINLILKPFPYIL